MASASSLQILSPGLPTPRPVIDNQTASRQLWRDRLHRLAIALLALLISLGAFIEGVRLRHNIWNATKPQRFQFDIQNAYHWGSRVMLAASAAAVRDGHSPDHATDWKYFARGYVGLYDEVVGNADDGNFYLDYSPARLLVASLWVRHDWLVYPRVRTWLGPYNYSAPLLRFNIACEAVAALLAFELVRYWMRRDHVVGSLPIVCGLITGLLVWFEPSLIVDAHIWPQWDTWLLPFYLGAVLAGSRDRWFIAGALLAIGAMFKGQVSIITPFLVLWPLFEGKPMASVRLLVGGTLTLGIITSPWIISGPLAWAVVLFVTLATAAVVFWLARGWTRTNGTLLIAATAMVALFGASFVFHGSYAWKEVSFGYPTRHFKALALGNTANLAAIVSEVPFDFHYQDIAFHLPAVGHRAGIAVPMKIFLEVLFGIAVICCSAAAARQSRRNSRQFLIVVAAPFVLMFVLLPQMHERYLIWGAVASALAVGVSLRMTLLHLLISLVSFLLVYPAVMGPGPVNNWLRQLVQAIHPGDAWMMLIVGAIYLYQIWRTPVDRVPNVIPVRPIELDETTDPFVARLPQLG